MPQPPRHRAGMARFIGSVWDGEGGRPGFWSSPEAESHEGLRTLFRGYLADRSALTRTLLPGEDAAATSDVRLLSRAYRRWGPALQRHVAGEYCAAIFDPASGELLLTNDALGCLPLYHTTGRAPFRFASHLDLLAEAVGEERLDERHVADFLLFGMSFDARTIYAAIERLRGGHSLRWAKGIVVDLESWSLADAAPVSYAKDADYDAQFRHLLGEAVTAAAGARTWAELSGGLDSSSIACLALRDRLLDLELVSIAFPRSATADETRWMTEVVDRYRARWRVLDGDALHPFSGFPERPLPEPSRNAIVSTLLARYEDLARENGVDVVLSGFGGDQALFGFLRPIHLCDRLRRLQFVAALRELRDWRSAAAQRRSLLHALKKELIDPLLRYYSDRSMSFEAALATAVPWLERAWLRRLGAPEVYRLAAPTPRMPSVGGQFYYEGLAQVSALAGQRWTQSTAAFELRHPLLYRPLIEFMHALPWEQKIRPGQDRVLQRRALAGVLPETIRLRRDKTCIDEAYFEGLRRSKAWFALLSERPLVVERGFVDGERWRETLALARFGHVPSQAVASFICTAALECWLRQRERGGDRPKSEAPDRQKDARPGLV